VRPLDVDGARSCSPRWTFDEGEADLTVLRVIARGRAGGRPCATSGTCSTRYERDGLAQHVAHDGVPGHHHGGLCSRAGVVRGASVHAARDGGRRGPASSTSSWWSTRRAAVPAVRERGAGWPAPTALPRKQPKRRKPWPDASDGDGQPPTSQRTRIASHPGGVDTSGALLHRTPALFERESRGHPSRHVAGGGAHGADSRRPHVLSCSYDQGAPPWIVVRERRTAACRPSTTSAGTAGPCCARRPKGASRPHPDYGPYQRLDLTDWTER
jgi:hypothetical protein